MEEKIIKKYKNGFMTKQDSDGYINLIVERNDGNGFSYLSYYGNIGIDYVLSEEESDHLAVYFKVENTIQISKEKFIEVIEKAKSQSEYVIGWHELIFGKFWRRIHHLEGFVKCNEFTAKELMRLAIDKDVKLNMETHYSNRFMCGGAWMNSGFSSSGKHLEDWEFEVPSFSETE